MEGNEFEECGELVFHHGEEEANDKEEEASRRWRWGGSEIDNNMYPDLVSPRIPP